MTLLLDSFPMSWWLQSPLNHLQYTMKFILDLMVPFKVKWTINLVVDLSVPWILVQILSGWCHPLSQDGEVLGPEPSRRTNGWHHTGSTLGQNPAAYKPIFQETGVELCIKGSPPYICAWVHSVLEIEIRMALFNLYTLFRKAIS